MIKKENEALELFQSGCNCSQSVFGALAPLFGIDKNSSLLIASAFGGGIARTQQICGALTGALMALGLKYGRGENGTEEDKQRGYFYARKLMKEFEDKFGGINCIDLLDGLNMQLPADAAKIKALNLHNTRCSRFVQTAVIMADRIINE